jgi:glycerol-3-phosphate dehydrogenase
MKPIMNRQHMLLTLRETKEWDILIIGGGATGLGAAVDAASRGYKTLLVEQSDFAKGTSGRSTKLIHGGVRYLRQGNFKLVQQSLQERGLLLKNAPHVCRAIPFLLPCFHWGQKWYYGFGLKMYDLLAGRLGLGTTRLLSRKNTIAKIPAVSKEKLTGGVLYQDGQFDDSRLAVNLAQTAVENGATVINYCKLTAILKEKGKISGAAVVDLLSGTSYTLRCKALINATGVFTDSVLLMDDSRHQPVITVSQGIHIVVNKKFFPGPEAMIIPKTDDGRVLFAVPWHNKVLIGTTDTPVSRIDPEPIPLREEIDFVLRHANRYLSSDITIRDIKSAFAGLRPLVKSVKENRTSRLPRDHVIFISPGGMVTVTGGKWTTYRLMAEQAVDKAASLTGLAKKECITSQLKIHGYQEIFNRDDPMHIYGSDAVSIKKLYENNPSLQDLLHPGLPYTKAEVIWAVQHEMALTIEDVLARRTRALLLDAKASIEAAPLVAWLLAAELGKDEVWQKEQVILFEKIAINYIIP